MNSGQVASLAKAGAYARDAQQGWGQQEYPEEILITDDEDEVITLFFVAVLDLLNCSYIHCRLI